MKLGILLTLRFFGRTDVQFQFRALLFFLLATGREVTRANDPRTKFVQAEHNGIPSPAKNTFSPLRRSVQIVLRDLCLNGLSLRTCHTPYGEELDLYEILIFGDDLIHVDEGVV